MVMGSVLWMEGVGLGLARNIVQRYALETGSEQGFGIGEKVAHDCADGPDDAVSAAARAYYCEMSFHGCPATGST
jgi:hypothetical protein